MQDERTRLLQVGGHYRGKPPLWATVDAADFEWLSQWNWSAGRYVYRPVHANGKRTTLMLHRAILGLEHGDERQGDHINRDRFDNRRSNLRIVTGAQNWQNMPSKGKTSRYRGVSWCKRDRLWLAQGTVDGRNHNLGRYAREEDAATAALSFRRERLPFAVD
jgi:hypothetical protein